MSYCCINGCTNNSNNSKKSELLKTESRRIGFHKFPSDQEVRTRWINAIGRNNWTPSKYSVVCTEHFAPEDINDTYLSSPRLRHNFVVPTIFPSYSTYRCIVNERKALHPREQNVGVEKSISTAINRSDNQDSAPSYSANEVQTEIILPTAQEQPEMPLLYMTGMVVTLGSVGQSSLVAPIVPSVQDHVLQPTENHEENNTEDKCHCCSFKIETLTKQVMWMKKKLADRSRAVKRLQNHQYKLKTRINYLKSVNYHLKKQRKLD